MSKKWILEADDANLAEFRVPKPGEHYLGLEGLTVYKAPKSTLISGKAVILHPVPDDVVIVDRKKFEEVARGGQLVPLCGKLDCARAIAELMNQVDAIRRCVREGISPPKPTDEILEILLIERERCLVAIRFRQDDREWESMHQQLRRVDQAIALREKELKGRGK